MALKLTRSGDTSYLQDHNLLKNLNAPDQHPIPSITGLKEALDSKASNIDLESAKDDMSIIAGDLIGVNDRVSEIERKIDDGEIGGGGTSSSPLKYTSVLEYEGTKLVKETFVGDINQAVSYSYDVFGNVSSKVIEKSNGEIVEAKYTYDNSNNLVKIEDGGTNEILISGLGGFSTYISRKGKTNSKITLDIDSIYRLEGLSSILGMEFMIKSENETSLIVTQSGIEVMSTVTKVNDVQKYSLGINKDTVIEIDGVAEYDLVISATKNIGKPISGGSGSSGSLDKDEITRIINEVVGPSIKDLQVQNIKTHLKYDRILGLSANACGDYYIDSGRGDE